MSQIESTDTALRLAIVRRAFTRSRRGYDADQVDELLDTVSALADQMLREAADTSRLLAEAEAELVGARAEVRELQEVTAATEHLLAGTRAELRDERLAHAGHREAQERLVVAEAELRVLRASTEDTERSLAQASSELEREQEVRAAAEARLADVHGQLATAEEQLADVNSRLAALAAERMQDPFAEVGGEIAALLRAAGEAAATARQRAGEEAAGVLTDAEELAVALLDDAEARTAEAEEQARRIIEAASAEAARITSAAQEAADTKAMEQEVRRALEEAIDSLLPASGDGRTELPPFAMEANGTDGGGRHPG